MTSSWMNRAVKASSICMVVAESLNLSIMKTTLRKQTQFVFVIDEIETNIKCSLAGQSSDC